MSETPGRRPRHALSDTGLSDTGSSDPVPSVPAPGGSREDLSGPAATTRWGVPEPSPAGDDASAADGGEDPHGDAPTRVLPVIPRPRDGYADRRYPSAVAVARLPEPFRPAPVRGPAAPASTGFRLPELPSSVRPVLPAVLGAATALILALGIVAGVNGAPDPVPAPEPPGPVSGP